MTEIQRHHWALWAAMNRHHGAPGALSWYSQAPIYTPPHRVDEHSSQRHHYSDEDCDVAELIGRAVTLCTDLERRALIEYHGAYPGAPKERAKRLAIMRRNLNRSTSGCEGIVRGAERYVCGMLRGWAVARVENVN